MLQQYDEQSFLSPITVLYLYSEIPKLIPIRKKTARCFYLIFPPRGRINSAFTLFSIYSDGFSMPAADSSSRRVKFVREGLRKYTYPKYHGNFFFLFSECYLPKITRASVKRHIYLYIYIYICGNKLRWGAIGIRKSRVIDRETLCVPRSSGTA